MRPSPQIRAIIARRKAAASPLPARRARKPRTVSHPAASAPLQPLIQSHGATEVTTFAIEVHVVHMSRQPGVTEDDVAANFDAMFGPGVWTRLRPHGRFMLKDGGGFHDDPSSSFIFIIPIAAFQGISA